MTYLVISVFIVNLIAIFIPKRLSRIEIYSTIMFAIIFELITNINLGLTLKLYSYFEIGAQPKDFLVIFGLFPAVNVIILNYFPFKRGIKKKAIYILIWTVILVAYEWGAVEWGFFNYYKWKLWYSILCYPTILVILIFNLMFTKKLIKN